MHQIKHLCSHENVVDDERGGCCVCVECGLVLEDKLFLPNYNETFLEYNLKTRNKEKEEEIRELLHRINLPDAYLDQIAENCLTKSKKKIPYIVYKTLNEDGCPISIKEISAVSGFPDSKIYKDQEKDKILISKPELMLEKYCRYFGLNFNSYTVIKEKIKGSSRSGHNPLTIIGANIYLHSKEVGLKIPIKTIARELKISCISIHRYLRLKN